MNNVLRFLENTNPIGLFVAACVVLFVGSKLSIGHPRTRTFCLSISGIVLVALLGHQYLQGRIFDDNLAEVSFRSLLAAGILLGVSWIVLPPLASVYEKLTMTLSRWSAGASQMFANRRRRREENERQKQRDKLDESSKREWENVSKKKEEEQRESADGRKRRDDARASCEVEYAMHGFEIRDRFPKEMYDAFVTKHLGDDKPPEYVEQRAAELCGIIKKHLEKVEGRGKKTLAELAQWYLDEKKNIEASAVMNDHDKQDLIADLEARYVNLQQQYLRSVQP